MVVYGGFEIIVEAQRSLNCLLSFVVSWRSLVGRLFAFTGIYVALLLWFLIFFKIFIKKY